MRDQGVHVHRLRSWAALVLCAASLLGACDSDDIAAPSIAPSTTGAPTEGATVTSAAGTTTPSPTAPESASSTVDSSAADTIAADTTAIEEDLVLRHPAGLELRYPNGWTASSASEIATEFTQSADCAAVEVVDFEPPIDSGEAEAGFTLRSVVQVCAQPAEARSVDEFLEDVYGGTAGFERIEIDGELAYRRGDSADSVAFTLHDDFTFQVLTSVVADPTLERQRIAEVDRIVESIAFT